MQVCAELRVKELLTWHSPTGIANKRIDQTVTWAFLKFCPHDPSKEQAGQFGGWRLCARLQDECAPKQVGAEVKSLQPKAEQKRKMDQMWEAGKAAIKAEPYTLRGMLAILLLR